VICNEEDTTQAQLRVVESILLDPIPAQSCMIASSSPAFATILD